MASSERWAARLDPALVPWAEFRTELSADGLPALRAALNQRRKQGAADRDLTGLEVADTAVSYGSGRSIPIRVYRGGGATAPGVLYCHAGAFVLGNLDTDDLQCVELARRAACTVVSVDYRLAPEHPHPAALDDAAAVLDWLAGNAGELGVDAARLAVAGSSAGGALAARLAQCSAAGDTAPVIFQLLHQPVLDDQLTPSQQEFDSTPGFDGPATALMWQYRMGAGVDRAGAVPAAAGDLTGLPPALITCSELDPLRDEAIDYALRLLWAGVPTELHVIPGTCHGFDSLVPDAQVSRDLFELQAAALRRALHAGR